MDILYKYFLKPILFRFDPEVVHDFFVNCGEWLGKFTVTRWMVGLIYDYRESSVHDNGYRKKNITKVVDGIFYRTPFMLSAGFDYNGRLTQILPHIGLGGEEVGSVTARPCEGNPAPRLTRLPKSQSILVNKGLKNDGVEAVIARLKKAPKYSGKTGGTNQNNFVVGISIARTNDPDSVAIQVGINDYAYSFKRLNEEGIGDYYTINISCPNAFGGEAFCSEPGLLDQLLAKLSTISCIKPVYIKMPINIPWAHFDALLKVADKYDYIRGVVIGNLNKDYAALDVREEAPQTYMGGLSGKPCNHPSTDLIAKTREMFGKRFTIIGVGGVVSPETAKEKFDAGADLVQLITGLIFEGPGLVKKLGKAM